MKRNTLATIVLAAILALTTSCATKERAMSQLEDFSYELRDNSARYTVHDWEQAGKKFVKIRKRISKHELDYTSYEKARIGQLEGECAGYMANGMREGVFDKARGFAEELRGIIQGILGTWKR
ncbi:MAG: hypothetical protein ILA39_00850 [Bacteroidaceae bacterium]|nr:hypothetical protein [Bacteroidaceae bacterium]